VVAFARTGSSHEDFEREGQRDGRRESDDPIDGAAEA
jgi:hypothetical protein